MERQEERKDERVALKNRLKKDGWTGGMEMKKIGREKRRDDADVGRRGTRRKRRSVRVNPGQSHALRP